ncbi:MAG: DciA family protein [Pseudomonadota bacterium]
MNNPLPIRKLLGGSRYSRLVSQARILMALETLLQELLPEPLKAHCHLLAIRDETLVLAADSPVWAARLRFHAPQLVKQLRHSQTVKLRTVRIRVRPPERPIPTERRKSVIQSSKNSTAALQQVAQTVSDPGLKTALLRLANRRFSR